jgi:hypothetical protein
MIAVMRSPEKRPIHGFSVTERNDFAVLFPMSPKDSTIRSIENRKKHPEIRINNILDMVEERFSNFRNVTGFPAKD